MDKGSTVKFLTNDSIKDSRSDDCIEIVSDQNDATNVEATLPGKVRKSILDDIKLFQDAIARKKFTRWIMLLGGIFIFLSGILLIVTLNMSKEIDDKGRTNLKYWHNLNMLLKNKQKYWEQNKRILPPPQTPPPPQQFHTVRTFSITDRKIAETAGKLHTLTHI